MNRKQVLEKQKALGSIAQSKTGDVILRKNIFEMRVLKTKLNELENEEKMWKNHFKYDVKEAKKEARSREMAKNMTFRRVAQVALATQRLKNLAPLFKQAHRPEDVAKEELEELESPQENAETFSKSLPRKIPRPFNDNVSRLPPLSPRQAHSSRLVSSFPDPVNLPSPLLVRRRFNTWTTDKSSRISAESNTITREVSGQGACLRASTMSPMLDKRFLELEAALVPMHPSEESDNEEKEEEEEEEQEEEDCFSDVGIVTL